LLERLDQTESLAAALATTPAEQLEERIHDVVHFFRQELLPHAKAEEAILYTVADEHVPTEAPYRWTDSLRYEHTVVHAAIEEMTAFMQGKDRTPEAVARFSRTVIKTLGLIRGHFGAEEHVVLDALDRSMTAADFQRDVVEPTERYVAEHGGEPGAKHHH
jgi:hypothetical protein